MLFTCRGGAIAIDEVIDIGEAIDEVIDIGEAIDVAMLRVFREYRISPMAAMSIAININEGHENRLNVSGKHIIPGGHRLGISIYRDTLAHDVAHYTVF